MGIEVRDQRLGERVGAALDVGRAHGDPILGLFRRAAYFVVGASTASPGPLEREVMALK